MRTSKFGAIAIAATLGLASLVQAQPQGPGYGHGPDRRPAPQRPMAQPGPQHGGYHQAGPQRPGPGPQMQHRDDRRPGAYGPGRPMPPQARGIGPDHRYHKGQRLPREWRHRQNVVNDWRGHHLHAPPRGQQWVQVGADYALVAIATGVITSLILNSN